MVLLRYRNCSVIFGTHGAAIPEDEQDEYSDSEENEMVTIRVDEGPHKDLEFDLSLLDFEVLFRPASGDGKEEKEEDSIVDLTC